MNLATLVNTVISVNVTDSPVCDTLALLTSGLDTWEAADSTFAATEHPGPLLEIPHEIPAVEPLAAKEPPASSTAVDFGHPTLVSLTSAHPTPGLTVATATLGPLAPPTFLPPQWLMREMAIPILAPDHNRPLQAPCIYIHYRGGGQDVAEPTSSPGAAGPAGGGEIRRSILELNPSVAFGAASDETRYRTAFGLGRCRSTVNPARSTPADSSLRQPLFNFGLSGPSPVAAAPGPAAGTPAFGVTPPPAGTPAFGAALPPGTDALDVLPIHAMRAADSPAPTADVPPVAAPATATTASMASLAASMSSLLAARDERIDALEGRLRDTRASVDTLAGLVHITVEQVRTLTANLAGSSDAGAETMRVLTVKLDDAVARMDAHIVPPRPAPCGGGRVDGPPDRGGGDGGAPAAACAGVPPVAADGLGGAALNAGPRAFRAGGGGVSHPRQHGPFHSDGNYDHSDGNYDDRNGVGTHGKRQMWSKSAVTDISNHLPEWPPWLSIALYHRILLLELHQPGVSSKLTLLVHERDPYNAYMQAALLKHLSHATIKHRLNDPSALETLQYRLGDTFGGGAADMEELKCDPEDTVKQLRVLNHFAVAFGEVRGALDGSNRRTVLMHEADSLMSNVKALTTAEGEVEYLCQVNNLVQSHFQLWQAVQLDLLVGTSSLARLVPEVTSRLTPSTQERTLEFFNDVVRAFRTDEVQRGMPTKFRDRFNSALERYTSALPTSVSFRGLGLADRSVGSAAYERMGAFERALNSSARQLEAVSDLHCIGPAGLLESHFGPWIRRMIGDHVHPSFAKGLLGFQRDGSGISDRTGA